MILVPPLIELAQLLTATQAVETNTETEADLAYLRGRGTSLGGLRPKCSVLDEDGWLAIGKFPSVRDERPVTKGEVLAMRLARKAGIDAADARIRGRLIEALRSRGVEPWLRRKPALPMMCHSPEPDRHPMPQPMPQMKVLDAKLAGVPAQPGDAMHGCPVHDLRAKLRRSGLRPTRQRVALGWLLFAKGDRHITAEKLYEEATGARVAISLATVYNTLHQFTEAGLLREIAVDGSKTYFDTNLSNHHHFLVEESNTLVDIPGSHISVGPVPDAPDGMEISRVDVIVRLRKR